MTFRLAWRLAQRELRGGARGFRLFVTCLFLGVAAIAAVGSITTALLEGLRADARTLLGGDAEIRLIHRPLPPDHEAAVAANAQVSRVMEMRAMVQRPDGAQRVLVELKGVDGAYPLYGAVRTTPTSPLTEALAQRDGTWGALVDPDVLSRTETAVGGRLVIGTETIEIRGTLDREPDRRVSGINLGPRVLVSANALPATGLVQPGSLVNYRYRVALPPTVDPGTWGDRLEAAFPESGWSVTTFRESNPGFRRFLDRMGHFLTLVGLTALLIGGVGISNAVRSFLESRTTTVATLKCLGASNRLVISVYLIQIAWVAGAGIALALAVGAATPALLVTLAEDLLPVRPQVRVFFQPLVVAAMFGILTTWVFTLWPLGRLGDIKPVALFRSRVVPVTGPPPRRYLGLIGLGAVGIAAVALADSSRPILTLAFVGSVVGAFVLFWGAAHGVVRWARSWRRIGSPGLRLAVANLRRPGAPTAAVVLSLGLGLTVLAAIALVEANLSWQLQRELPAAAPAFFFVDIQQNQAEAFQQTLDGIDGVERVERVPMLRGRIIRLNNTAVSDAVIDDQARWAVESDRGLTYAAAPPPGSKVTQGTWWPEAYAGEPLVSFDANLAASMGLRVGDTLTVNVLGRELTAKIANLRQINWQSMGINFTLVFSPNALQRAPHTFLATAYTQPEAEEPVHLAISKQFPNITSVRVREAIDEARRLVGGIAAVVRVAAWFTLFAGMVVLAGSMLANHQRRVYDAVVLKVLGATRPKVLGMFLLEYGLLSGVTAVLACALGSLAAYGVVTQLMQSPWVFHPVTLASTVVTCALVTLGLGLVGTWRALGQKAAPLLRNE